MIGLFKTALLLYGRGFEDTSKRTLLLYGRALLLYGRALLLYGRPVSTLTRTPGTKNRIQYRLNK